MSGEVNARTVGVLCSFSFIPHVNMCVNHSCCDTFHADIYVIGYVWHKSIKLINKSVKLTNKSIKLTNKSIKLTNIVRF